MARVERLSPDQRHTCQHFHFSNNEQEIQELDKFLKDFRQKYQIDSIVGILGTADNKLDKLKAAQEKCVSDLLDNLPYIKVAVLSGGTKDGLPAVAIKEAKKRNLPTIGVFPPNGAKDALFDLLDLAIQTAPPVVGEASWGSETPTLIRIPDAVVIIGGGTGTSVEVFSILKRNAYILALIEKKKNINNLTPTYIVPIIGTGGVASRFPYHPEIESNREFLPPSIVMDGKEAANFLQQNLYYKNLHRT